MVGLLFALACQATPAPEPAVSPAPLVIEARVRVSLPFERPMPLLDGTVRLVESHVDHDDDMGASGGGGALELTRGDETTRVDFTLNRPFEAWGHRMAVFGASGSVELSVFPPGAPFEP